MSTLYRQYRPQVFQDISGQPQVTDILQQAILKNRIAHAYLFYGPRGTGKTTSARVFAKRLNCLKASATESEPCTKCDLCVAAQTNSAIDIIEIDAASHRGIDDIRALRDATRLRPSQGKYKIYIIDEVHMLTNEAFAALLKTLEEPSANTIFILATTEFHKVPATILSRCQVYRFRRATAEELRERLHDIIQQEERSVEPAAIDFIIQRSDGCYRDAESLLGQVLTAEEGSITEEGITTFLGLPPRNLTRQFIEALLHGVSSPALTVLDTIFVNGFDPEQFLKETILFARDFALELAKQEKLDPRQAKLTEIIRALLQASQDLVYVPDPLVALQLAILSVTSQKGVTPQPVAAPIAKPTPAQQPMVKPPVENAVPAEVAPQPQPSSSGVSLSQVQSLWPAMIETMKSANPVASTFLRAVEPKKVDGTVITIHAYYSLHRNFLEKPEHKRAIESHMSTQLATNVSIRCELHEQKPDAQAKPALNRLSQPPANREDEAMYQTVKEIFGSSIVEEKR